MAYDPVGDKVYVAYWGNDVVDIFNRDGSKHGTIDLEFDVWGILTSIDIHKDVLYGSTDNQLYVRSAELHSFFKQKKTVFGPFDSSGNGNIIVNDDGVYLVNYFQNAVIQYDFSGNETKRFTTSELRYPQDAAFDSEGNLHVTGAYNKKVYVFDASGNKVSSYSEWASNEPWGIFVDSLGNSFVSNRRGDRLSIFDKDRNYHALWTFPNKVVEVVLLPDCEVWAAAGHNKAIMVFKR